MRKPTEKFYLSVEGETEKWYFEWLEKTIKHSELATSNAKFLCRVSKDPRKFVKTLTVPGEIEIIHVFDRESEDETHRNGFSRTLMQMDQAQNMGKTVTYLLGYSNFTFELWMALHKGECNKCKSHRSQYLEDINRAYGECFRSLSAYKEEKNFQRLLDKLSLDNVIQAIGRSRVIMETNQNNRYILRKEHGFSYYRENPSLSIWEYVETILRSCAILPKV
ncbi:MAG: RloB domain-containing protein [Clostridiaceae bacterium]|nr:RloB domain-containing protein [Clostridiaceae bacterium]